VADVAEVVDMAPGDLVKLESRNGCRVRCGRERVVSCVRCGRVPERSLTEALRPERRAGRFSLSSIEWSIESPLGR
jgi:hypothetical protein